VAVEQLTPSLAASLDGPAWLSDLRVAAAERFAASTLPDPSLEEWRYSRVESIELDRFAPVPADAAAPDVPAAVLAVADALGDCAGRVVMIDGRVALAELAPAFADRGVHFGRLADLATAPVGADIAETDAFGELNAAFGTDPLALVVPRGVVVDRPLHLVQHVTVPGALVLPRLVVDAGDDAEVQLVEWSSSPDGVESLVIPRTSVTVGRAARVSIVGVNAWGSSILQLGALVASVGQEATLRSTHVALGGDYARNRIDCRLVGRGATGRLSALYLGDGDQMHDLRTFQTHEARDTTSALLFKGALDDRSRAVYTGMIRVDHEGRGSNADQTNRVIKLSDDAWAESVPNLEINHNDVKCSHATAVGPIDEDQRFYLESRGVPPEVAERLVVNGFFEEVLDTVPNREVVALVRPMIAERLGGVR